MALLYWAPRYHRIWGSQFCNPWGQCSSILLITWDQSTSQKCSKLAPTFLGPDSECKSGPKAASKCVGVEEVETLAQ